MYKFKIRPKPIKIFAFFFGHIVLIFLGLTILKNSVSENAIKCNEENKKGLFLSAYSAQSWAFFTKDTKEPSMRVYQFDDDKWKEMKFKNMQFKNIFGVIKKDRITIHVLEGKFKEMPIDVIKDSRYLPSIMSIHNKIISKELTPLRLRGFTRLPKGKYILVYRRVTPWAWFSRIKRPVLMRSKYLVLYNL